MSTIYNEYFAGYLSKVEGMNHVEALEFNHGAFLELLHSIDEEKSMFRYAEDKWSIKELIAHVIDSERVFGYRAMRFSRNDKTDLPGYDEKNYGIFCGADERTLKDLSEEFNLIRKSSLALFRSFNEEMLERSGTANGMEMDVKSLGLLIAGHCQHHLTIIKERYLN